MVHVPVTTPDADEGLVHTDDLGIMCGEAGSEFCHSQNRTCGATLEPYIDSRGKIVVDICVRAELPAAGISSNAIRDAAAMALMPIALNVMQIVEAISNHRANEITRARARGKNSRGW